MRRQPAQGLIGITHALALSLALSRRQIGIGLVEPQPHMARGWTGELVVGPILGVAVGAAEALLHLPVAEAQRSRALLRDAL